MKIWIPLTEDELLIFRKEKGDEYDLHDVAITDVVVERVPPKYM